MRMIRTAAWRLATTGRLSTARWASANNNNNLPTTTFRQGQKIQVEVVSFGPLGASVVRVVTLLQTIYTNIIYCVTLNVNETHTLCFSIA